MNLNFHAAVTPLITFALACASGLWARQLHIAVSGHEPPSINLDKRTWAIWCGFMFLATALATLAYIGGV